MTPTTNPVGPGGQWDQEYGVALHDQEEGYQQPITFRSGSSQVLKDFRINPSTHPCWQQGQGHGVVLHVQWECYQF